MTDREQVEDRYFRLLKDALLDRHYIDDEVRLDYLGTLPAGTPPDAESLRDPPRTMWVRYQRLVDGRETGRSSDAANGIWYTPYTDMGRPALDHLHATVEGVIDQGVPGDLAEVGVGRGGGGILMRAVLDVRRDPDRVVWEIDPFVANDPAILADEPPWRRRLRADLHQVRDGFDRFHLLDDRVRFVQGEYSASLADHPIEAIAVLRIGIDAGFDVGKVLAALLPRVSPGGVVIVEGTGRTPIERRLSAFRSARRVAEPVEQIDWNTSTWTVTAPAATDGPDDEPVRAPHRVPLAPPTGDDGPDLSVVVVFYDMAREAVRTLRSLSRTYQRGIDDLTYEVIVVDNGSHADQALDRAAVESHGPEFRLITLADAPASPTVALNRGIAESRGQAVAVMIDGAHVLTPGVFRHAIDAMTTYDPAVVAIQQWYVGPGQQGDAQQAGYDQAIEDQLFRNIRWPVDGYRLFEIGHFIGDRDWFDGIVESNCLFIPRWLLEQVGGFDDSFDMPGGGYANLDLFERLHSHPGVTPASVLGEGTFHQFHGGTTTNVSDEAVRRQRVFSYGAHFRDLRGRGLAGLNKPVHYVGSMDTKAARRTRSRREVRLAFDVDRDPVGSTEAAPLPVPEEVKLAAIEALWDVQAWRDSTWLGHPVARYPTDLHSFQELMAQVRADTIVLLGDDVGLGGRALFAASVADGLGLGRVVAAGRSEVASRPEHPRISHVEGDPVDPAVRAAIEARAGDGSWLLVIGLGSPQRVIGAFEAFAAHVPVGGYVVVETTVVNGRPAASDFGPGPHEAVNDILKRHPQFVPDVAFESYTVTFNKNGFLRRTTEG